MRCSCIERRDVQGLRDGVDALFISAPVVREIDEEISAAHGLEPDWLNDAVKGFLPGDDAQPVTACIDLLAATYPMGQLLPRHRYIAEDVTARAEALRAS